MTSVSDRYQLWKHTAFEQWVVEQGVKVIGGQIHPRDRPRALGPDRMRLRLPRPHSRPADGTFKRERHMYEEIFYVAKGRGATSVWYDDGPKQTFEWQEGTVFPIPLREYVFSSEANFLDRFDPNDGMYFSGKSIKVEDRHMETNFISNLKGVALCMDHRMAAAKAEEKE